ncbi:MAG: efflux transporter outer membrane subunit, partial [Gammaproteobacteria bacterium]
GVEGRRELSGDNESTTNESLFGALGFTLPLDMFGRNRREVEAARASLEVAEAELRDVVLTRSTDVAREYLRLRGGQRQLELLEESVALQEKTLSVVKSRFQAGLSPELDLRRAETSVERLRADIPPLQESLTNSRNLLANLTGEYPGAFEETLRKTAAIPSYQREIPAPIPVDVLRQRPDIRRAEAELKRTIAEIGVAEADYYPVFRLFGQLRVGTSGFSGDPSMDLIIGSLGALVEQVITDGGAREANVENARARADEALANYRQALLDAAQSIETTLAALKSSLARQESLGKAVESSSRSFNQAENLYQLGLISFLDVVDAQRVLASAEQQLAAERTNYATRIATLFRVLGTNVEN